MSDESVWYYARGESEQGPITTAQIKALAATGALRRDDLVWKEGMDTWVPASEVGDLFPRDKNRKESAPPSGDNGNRKAAKVAPRPARSANGADEIDWRQVSLSVGRTLVVLGVLTVVMSRGCDSLGARKVARLQAMSTTPDAAEELRTVARATEAEHLMWGYWRHLGFLFGTLSLALGLLSVTPLIEGPERWICLVMLAIVLYSVYSSDSVWSGTF